MCQVVGFRTWKDPTPLGDFVLSLQNFASGNLGVVDSLDAREIFALARLAFRDSSDVPRVLPAGRLPTPPPIFNPLFGNLCVFGDSGFSARGSVQKSKTKSVGPTLKSFHFHKINDLTVGGSSAL